MEELERLGMIPTGRGAWHGTTITEVRPGSFMAWTVTARIDEESTNPLRRYGVLVRVAGDLGEYSARFVACRADLPLLAAAAMRDPYIVTRAGGRFN